MSRSQFTANIDGMNYTSSTISISGENIEYIEICGEKFVQLNNSVVSIIYAYVYANALSLNVNDRLAYPLMKFPYNYTLWNLWNQTDWTEADEVKRIKKIYDNAILRKESSHIKFPLIMENVPVSGGHNATLIHIDIAIWMTYLVDMDKKDELFTLLKYPPSNEYEKRISKLTEQHAKEIEALKQEYESKIEELNKKITDLKAAIQIVHSIE